MRKNSQPCGMSLTLAVAANARKKRAKRVAMEATENFMILLVVEICRLGSISRAFWFEKSRRSTRIIRFPYTKISQSCSLFETLSIGQTAA